MRHDSSAVLPRVIAAVAGLFGLASILSGGMVLFGPPQAQAAAGDFVPFVVWFNTLAGVAYLVAAAAIWRGARSAPGLAWAIAGATALVALAFAVVALGGTAFETRTVGALAFRTTFWAGIALLLSRRCPA